MVVIDTYLARGASNGGFSFHDRGGPYGRTKGPKRGGGRRDRAPYRSLECVCEPSAELLMGRNSHGVAAILAGERCVLPPPADAAATSGRD